MADSPKIARLILLPAEKYINEIIRFYGSRSAHLVIAYNADSFTPSKTYPVPLISYAGVGAETAREFSFPEKIAAHPLGTQWRVYAKAAAAFPEIEQWVIHDYDVLCKPTDRDLCEKVPAGHYGTLGLPIPRYRPGINAAAWRKKTWPYTHMPYENLWHARDTITQRTDAHL